MPSDSKKRAQQKKKEQANNRNKKTVARVTNTQDNGSSSNGGQKEERELTAEEALCLKLEEEANMNSEARSCTGSLAVHPRSRDIKITNFSITFYGSELLQDTLLELNCTRRYGLVGLNGCGKSSLLAALGRREVPIPEHIDIFHLTREMPASDKTALQCVMEVDEERVRLEKRAEELVQNGDDDNQEALLDVYDRLDELSADTAETRAAHILHGLGFTTEMQRKATKDFSGGWRMRIALARALYVKPHLLLLDEPTNHLDLDACVWLEEELKKYKRILVLISHSQDFLNGVCTNIVHLNKRSLKYYTGNYEAFVRTRMELLEYQIKQYNWEQDQIAHMKKKSALSLKKNPRNKCKDSDTRSGGEDNDDDDGDKDDKTDKSDKNDKKDEKDKKDGDEDNDESKDKDVAKGDDNTEDGGNDGDKDEGKKDDVNKDDNRKNDDHKADDHKDAVVFTKSHH